MTDDKIWLGKFGIQIRLKRQSRGWSLRKLAHHCDIDHSDLSRIELGKSNITILTLKEIASGLAIRVIDLLNFE